MAGLVIRPRARIFHGHDWVYGTEVKKIFGEPKPGDVVSLKDFRDRPLGSAIYNPESQIVARRISRRKQDLDLDFFQRRIQRANEYREQLGYADGPRVYRMVWSESDGLPGVVIDRYGDQFVVQTLTLAMDLNKELIFQAIQEQFSPVSIFERNDSPVRAAEGMESVVRTVYGTTKAESLEIGGVTFQVDPGEGQKTGLYLDQFDNYAKVAGLAAGRKVLDCFCNQGGFALYAGKAGAASVTGVDSSVDALEAARLNAQASGVEAEFVEWNVFDYLKHAETEKRDTCVSSPLSV